MFNLHFTESYTATVSNKSDKSQGQAKQGANSFALNVISCCIFHWNGYQILFFDGGEKKQLFGGTDFFL